MSHITAATMLLLIRFIFIETSTVYCMQHEVFSAHDDKTTAFSVRVALWQLTTRCRQRQTHQILADEHPDKDGEEDAADEPEGSEGIKLLWLGLSVLGRLLVGQLTSQFHGIIETREVLLEALARGPVVRCPLPPGSLPDPYDVIL